MSVYLVTFNLGVRHMGIQCHRALRHNSRSVAVRALRQGPQWVFGPMAGMHAATPVTHSDDYTDDQTAYRLGQRAQVEERSAMVGSPFSSLTTQA
jgi:hypothetical protein